MTYLSVSLKLAKVNFTLIKRANFLLQSRHKTSIKQKGEIAIDEAYSFETPLIVIKNLGVSLIPPLVRTIVSKNRGGEIVRRLR